jgi:DNA-binding NarL/FixJ family response regulator
LRRDPKWTEEQIRTVEAQIRDTLSDTSNFQTKRSQETSTDDSRLMGYSCKDISVRFDISAKSVETYKTRCFDKLGLESRADLVRYARLQGWFARAHENAPEFSMTQKSGS